MSKRHKMSARSSRRDFSSKARKLHKRNIVHPMRGGIRA